MTFDQDWQNERATPKLKEWITRKLGCDIVGVELSDEQLEDSIRDAQEYWMQWIGRVRAADLTLSSAREYAAALIGPDVDSVVDVYFDAYDDGMRDTYGWADVSVNPFQYVYEERGGYSSVIQYLMYREDARKIISSDRDWMWDKTRRMLIISPADDQSRVVKVIYLSRYFDYSALTTYEWRMFREYALAKSMQTLAIIRMKFSEKPSAAGGSFSMDGDSMWANAEAMLMNIEEKMSKLQQPVGILTG